MAPRKVTPPMQRMLAKSDVREQGYVTPCRVSTGYKQRGYARTFVGSRVDGSDRCRPTHIVAWEIHNGRRVSEGKQIDHMCCDPRWCKGGPTCPHRACFEPTHLAEVTPRENSLRGNSFVAIQSRQTHCKRGHEFTAENTYVTKSGSRQCRTCYNANKNARRQSARARRKTSGAPG